jgi:hypothetical protein
VIARERLCLGILEAEDIRQVFGEFPEIHQLLVILVCYSYRVTMIPTPGQTYRHYKGGTYVVLFLATHTETKEQLVIYRNLEHDSLWARPLSEWQKPVDGQPNTERFQPC